MGKQPLARTVAVVVVVGTTVSTFFLVLDHMRFSSAESSTLADSQGPTVAGTSVPAPISEGFEGPGYTYSVTTTRSPSYGLNRERAHSGLQSLKAGPSPCASDCYGDNDYAVRLRWDTGGLWVASVEFWGLEESSRAENFGQTAYVELDGNLVYASAFDPAQDCGPGRWIHYRVPLNQAADEVALYLHDITSTGSLYVDDATLAFGTTSEATMSRVC